MSHVTMLRRGFVADRPATVDLAPAESAGAPVHLTPANIEAGVSELLNWNVRDGDEPEIIVLAVLQAVLGGSARRP